MPPPEVEFVVDPGLAREARYDDKRHLTTLDTRWIARSAANQRMGKNPQLPLEQD